MVNPTRQPLFFTICARSRVVVVLPLVPVTAIIGIRLGFPGGYNISITGAATFLGKPSEGAKCIRKPGAAFTSKIQPPFSLSGCVRFSAMMSTPQTSNPMTREIRSHKKMFSGCIMSVTSMEVPPVLKFAVDFKYTISSLRGTVSKV